VLVLAAMCSPSLIGFPPPAPRVVGPASSGQPSDPAAGGSAGASAAGGVATAVAAAPVSSVDDTAALEKAVFDQTNAERATQGCAALRLDSQLVQAARGHSTDMARNAFFGHTGSDGKDPGARMADAGYDASGGWAENIAKGQATATAVMSAWLGSPEHRANILNCGMRAIGVGAARAANGQLYWTQDFGTR
jgi:uncharacterized protein YkwD